MVVVGILAAEEVAAAVTSECLCQIKHNLSAPENKSGRAYPRHVQFFRYRRCIPSTPALRALTTNCVRLRT